MVGGLVGTRWNEVNVDIQQGGCRVKEANIAARFFFCLTQGRPMHESRVDGFHVPTGLQPFFQLGVLQERDAPSLGIDHEGAGGEVRLCLMARQRLFKLRHHHAHRFETARFVGVRGHVRIEDREKALRHGAMQGIPRGEGAGKIPVASVVGNRVESRRPARMPTAVSATADAGELSLEF